MFCKNLCLRIIHCRPEKSKQQKWPNALSCKHIGHLVRASTEIPVKAWKKSKNTTKGLPFLALCRCLFLVVQLSELLLQFNFQ